MKEKKKTQMRKLFHKAAPAFRQGCTCFALCTHIPLVTEAGTCTCLLQVLHGKTSPAPHESLYNQLLYVLADCHREETLSLWTRAFPLLWGSRRGQSRLPLKACQCSSPISLDTLLPHSSLQSLLSGLAAKIFLIVMQYSWKVRIK